MKNSKKLLPLFALALGIGLVFIQSAFAVKIEPPTYYNAAGTGMPPNWQPLGAKVIGTEKGEFSCEENSVRDCLASRSGEIYMIVAYGEFIENQ